MGFSAPGPLHSFAVRGGRVWPLSRTGEQGPHQAQTLESRMEERDAALRPIDAGFCHFTLIVILQLQPRKIH